MPGTTTEPPDRRLTVGRLCVVVRAGVCGLASSCWRRRTGVAVRADYVAGVPVLVEPDAVPAVVPLVVAAAAPTV